MTKQEFIINPVVILAQAAIETGWGRMLVSICKSIEKAITN